MMEKKKKNFNNSTFYHISSYTTNWGSFNIFK